MAVRPDTAVAGDLDAAVADLAERFRLALEIPERAGTSISAGDLRRRLDEPLPERGMPIEQLLGELEGKVAPGLTGSAGPRYFGYVTGGVLPGAALAQAWTAAVDQNPGLWTLSPAGAELDQLTVGWVADLLGFPRGSGTITTGATMANTVGLGAARHWFAKRHGVDVAVAGVRALPEFAVYASEELHLSDHKALRTLGLGSGCVRALPIDEGYAMEVEPLVGAIERDRAAGIEPAIVIAQAGSVNTGASDPLDAIADVCAEHGLWLHVDGAFGAFFRLCEHTASLVRGLERADSLAVDGHKWLNLPNGIGFALLRDADLHREAYGLTPAAYLTQGAEIGIDQYHLGIEASRGWRGPATWAALKQLGREGIVELVTRCCDLTAELAGFVDASPRLELTAPARTCVVCFRYRPPGWAEGTELDELNRSIQQDVAESGEVFLTGASLASGFCQRVCIVSWRTRSEDIVALVDAVDAAGARLAGG